MESKSTIEQAAAPATPQQAREESQKHRAALIRGRGLIALGIMLLLLFSAVMAAVLFLDPLTFDVPITRAVQELDFRPLNWLLLAVSAPGFAPWNLIFPAVIILGVALLKRIAEAAFLALASVAALSEGLVKAVVHRGRPSDTLVHVVQHLDSYSFPSGHVTQYTLFFGFCFYLVFTLLQRGLPRTLLLIVLGGLIVLVGPSRIWMGQHWASDVLGGYTLGFGLLLLIIWAYRAYEARRLTHQVPAGVAARKS